MLTTLQKNFTHAIAWNAAFYIFYKLTSLSLTIFLYKKLSHSCFNQWALANSIIFITLLWLDLGLKKSIPRFLPLFYNHPTTLKKHLYTLLFVKTITLIAITPLLYFFLINALTINPTPIIILFISEGITTLFLIFYHSHFFQKQFSLIQSASLAFETILNLSFLFLLPHPQHNIVTFLFISKTIANVGIILLSFYYLPLIYKKTLSTTITPTIPPPNITTTFVKHSFVMWVTTTLQSLSERNILFPLITYTAGPANANNFKLIQDAALFFQRIPLKIIGIADTSLLSATLLTSFNNPKYLKSAFTTIFKTFFILALPLLFLGTFIFLKNNNFISPHSLFLFFIITICSAIELILSPYARVLEVNLLYKPLLLSYLPYTIGLLILIFYYSSHTISLITFIGSIYALRFLTMLSIAIITKKQFHITLPKQFISIIASATLVLALLTWKLF